MTTEASRCVTMTAGQDLRGDLFELLTVENDGGVAKVIKSAAATDVIVGVLAENPRSDVSTDGYPVPVMLLHGVVPMKAGGAITAGEIVISHGGTTPGTVEGVAGLGALAADQMGVGIALETAASGDIFRVLAMPIAAPHSA